MSQEKIGRYEIEDKLGHGGMSSVYVATDPFMKRKVAIKVLSSKLVSDAMFHEHFQREAEVIASLEHSCIVPIFDFGWHGDQPYIVMRYMNGGTFQDQIESEKIRLTDLARIIGRIAQGLDAAHLKGIVHRDVKPSNILFDDSKKAFLSDFGLAKLLHQSTGSTGSFLIGTPAYMSPEQIQNYPLDGRSDIYGLGIVIYRALANRLPFENDSPMAMAVAQVTEDIPDHREVRPDLNASWTEILEKALAKEPDERYKTAGELAQDISEVASGSWYLRKIMED
jgi:serine/threonine-protein kinase